MEGSSKQVRLAVWTTPRSVSTALTNVFSLVEDSTIFFESYLGAHWFGPECLQDAGHLASAKALVGKAAAESTLTRGYESPECTYGKVKEQLDAPHTGKKLVFCKDMAFSVVDKLDFLPKEYRHVFLIRNPIKVFTAWKKMYERFTSKAVQLDEVAPTLFPRGFGFSEMAKLLEHVREVHDPKAIIIDADDLLADPKAILSALFKEIGLPFDEKYLQWKVGDTITEQRMPSNVSPQAWRKNEVWQYYKRAFDGASFAKPRVLPERSSVPADALRCADVSMPHYEQMYAQRLSPK